MSVPDQLCPGPGLAFASLDIQEAIDHGQNASALNDISNKRHHEFLAGRQVANMALRQLIPDFGNTPMGRLPDGQADWPEGMVGSITHSHGLAMAMVGKREQWRGVGLDLETVMSADRAQRVAEKVLTPEELDRSRSLAPEHYAQRVTLAFAAKEAVFKAIYPLVLRRFYFHDVSLEADHRLKLLHTLHPDWPAGSEVPLHCRVIEPVAKDAPRILCWVLIPQA